MLKDILSQLHLSGRRGAHPVLRAAMAELGLEPEPHFRRKGPYRSRRINGRRVRIASTKS